MRIVIFSLNYPPLVNPRSFRTKQIYESFSERFTTLVISSKSNSDSSSEPNIIRCGFKYHSNVHQRAQLKQYRILRFFHSLIWPDDKIFQNKFHFLIYLFKYRKKEDRIITVSNPFTSHIIGLSLKIIFKHKWIVDIGDAYYTSNHNSLLSKWFESFVLQKADFVIVNSESLLKHFSHLHKISLQKFIHIPNEIHFEIRQIHKTQSDQIRISYFGNSYSGVREATQEMNILLELARQYHDKKLKIQVFGIQDPSIYKMAKINPEILVIGFCKNEEELIEAYSNTDFLVVFANKNNPGLPSKCYEYIATGLPVIHFYYSKNDPAYIYLQSQGARIFHCEIGKGDPGELIQFIRTHLKYSPRQTDSEGTSIGNQKFTWKEVIDKM
jgi:glycosyltransferase involved in cell wall biosynthesis